MCASNKNICIAMIEGYHNWWKLWWTWNGKTIIAGFGGMSIIPMVYLSWNQKYASILATTVMVNTFWVAICYDVMWVFHNLSRLNEDSSDNVTIGLLNNWHRWSQKNTNLSYLFLQTNKKHHQMANLMHKYSTPVECSNDIISRCLFRS